MVRLQPFVAIRLVIWPNATGAKAGFGNQKPGREAGFCFARDKAKRQCLA
jgi:hypothetical protein